MKLGVSHCCSIGQAMSSSWMDISDFAVLVPKLSSVGNLHSQDSYLASGGRIRSQEGLL